MPFWPQLPFRRCPHESLRRIPLSSSACSAYRVRRRGLQMQSRGRSGGVSGCALRRRPVASCTDRIASAAGSDRRHGGGIRTGFTARAGARQSARCRDVRHEGAQHARVGSSPESHANQGQRRMARGVDVSFATGREKSPPVRQRHADGGNVRTDASGSEPLYCRWKLTPKLCASHGPVFFRLPPLDVRS